MEATAEIPKLQFAKVGKNRERKKGGAPVWLRGAKGGNSLLGALGGDGISGGGSLITQLLPKFIMASMVASIGVGAFGLKMALGPQKAFQSAAKPKKLFDSAPSSSQKYSGDLSSLPGGGGPNQSGLSMIQGGLGEDAAAQAANQAAQGQGGKGGQDAAAQNGKDGKDGQGAAGAPDANALAAAAAAAAGGGAGGAGGNSPFSSRFGALSAGFGGGHSSPFSSGGMFGGVGHAFDNGKLNGFGGQAQAGRAQAAASPTARNPASRLAARQLNNAFLGSQTAARNTTGVGEGASYSASKPFDNGGQQSGIVQGPIGGATTPAGGAGAGNGNANSGGSGGGSTNPSGPTLGGAPSNPMTDCVRLLGPDYSNSANGGCVQTTTGTSVDPADMLFKIIQALLVIGMVLSIIQMIIWLQTAAGATLSPTFVRIGQALMGIGMLVGVLGLAMATSTSHHLEGAMFGVIGGMIAASAWFNAFHEFATEIPQFAVGFIAPLAGELMGSVFAGMHLSSSSSFQ